MLGGNQQRSKIEGNLQVGGWSCEGVTSELWPQNKKGLIVQRMRGEGACQSEEQAVQTVMGQSWIWAVG